MKIAIIGGGSSYTPELLDGLLARQVTLGLSEICLMDVDPDRLHMNAGFVQRMAETMPVACALRHTLSLEEAVRDARYVITQIRVGQMPARIADEQLGLRHGLIGQETTGIGGFACALRTIPAILQVAHTMEAVNPQGFLINFTNPAGIITESVLRHSHIRTVGLCNIPIGIHMALIEAFGGAVDDYALDYVGLNHLSWVRRITKNGEDITPEAVQHFIAHAEEEWNYPPIRQAMVDVMQRLGMWCNSYLQYFYAPTDSIAYQQAQEQTRGEAVLEIEKQLFAQYCDPNCTRKPEMLSKRGGAHYSTAAFRLLEAIQQNKQSRQVVCCANEGAIPGMDDKAAVELTATLKAEGARALPQEAPPPIMNGLMHVVKAYETLTVQAAVSHDKKSARNWAFQALLAHPLMPGARRCKELLDDVLEVNQPYLPERWYR